MAQQLNLFSEIYSQKTITKKIRLIEFFAGIGAQYKALKLLTNNVESYKTVEWAYNSIVCYNAIHIKDFKNYSEGKTRDEMLSRIKGISVNYSDPLDDKQLSRKNDKWIRNAYNNIIATHNLVNIMNVKGSDLEIVNKETYEYVLTYSFPCQDLSLAGKRAGMATSQAQGGTRSGLLWEVERILTELDIKNRPDILLMENVPEVVGAGNLEYFNKWELKLEELGYQNYIKILNAKNYGIPQNRRRCFMISILGNYAYTFPDEMTLKYKLKDLLEKNVDEKYYLSDKAISGIVYTDFNQKKLENRTEKDGVMKTIQARDYKDPKLIVECDLNKFNHEQSNRVYSPDGVSPTITTKGIDDVRSVKIVNKNGGGQPIMVKDATKKGYREAQEGDGVNISSRAKYQRGNVQKDKAQTLKTSIEVGVVVKK